MMSYDVVPLVYLVAMYLSIVPLFIVRFVIFCVSIHFESRVFRVPEIHPSWAAQLPRRPKSFKELVDLDLDTNFSRSSWFSNQNFAGDIAERKVALFFLP